MQKHNEIVADVAGIDWIEEWSKKVDWERAAEAYYLSPFGHSVLLHSNGDITVLESGVSLGDDSDVVVSLECPGFANLDHSDFEVGFEWDDEAGLYRDEKTGEPVGSLADLWRLAIKHGMDLEFRDWVLYEVLPEQMEEE